MARKYRADKRGTYAVYERSSVDDAVAAVRGGMSLRKAAEKYKIPKSTINDRVKEKVPMDAKSGRKPYLPAEIENDIIKKATSSAAKGFGISKRQLLLKVGTLCKKTSVASFKNGIPGKDWWYSFVKRHPEVSLRKPEKLETNRACMLNKPLDPMGKMFQNASSLKPLGQLKPNCPGMIIGRSSTLFEHFPIGSNVNLCIAVVAILEFRST
jgi:transposase